MSNALIHLLKSMHCVFSLVHHGNVCIVRGGELKRDLT